MWTWVLPLALLIGVAVPTDNPRAGTVVCISASNSYTEGKTEALLRKRFSDIHLEVTAPYLSYERRRSILVRSSDMQLVRALIVRGRVKLRFVPHGPEYPSSEPFKSAALLSDDFGHPIMVFTVKDRPSFYEFTKLNVGKSLGIFLDGRRVVAAHIHEPIEGSGEVAMPRDIGRLDVLAAVVDAGPIPKNVTVSLGKPPSSCH